MEKPFRKFLSLFSALVIFPLAIGLSSCGSVATPGAGDLTDPPQSDVQDLTTPPAPTTAADMKVFQNVLRLLIRYQDGQFSVTDSRVMAANPTPLPKVADRAPLVVQTISKDGGVLFSGGIHDPRIAQMDIEEPKRPGVWQHKEITLSESVFQLKIPIEEGLGELRIIENRSGKQLLQIDVTPYLEGS